MSRSEQDQQDLRILGQAISQIRAEQGMSMAELAAATGSHLTLIQAVEGGRRSPTFGRLVALADGLGVQPSAFVIRAEELKAREEASGEASAPD